MFERFTSASSDQLLHIYLNDHRTGAVAAHALAERSRTANAGTEFGSFLDEFARDLAEDIDQLDTVLAACSVPKNGPKLAVARLGIALGRLKLNGRLTEYSPLSRVLEFEAMSIGVLGKRQLWTTIAGLPPDHAAASAVDALQLIERAEAQAERLRELSDRAAAVAFPSTDAETLSGDDDERVRGTCRQP